MKTIVPNQKERVGQWVAEKIGCSKDWGAYEALGLEENGDLIAGVVIDGYAKNARCSIHCAGEGKRWLNREFLFAVFDYVFRQLNCRVVVTPVNSENVASMKFIAHLGFEEQLRIEGGSPEGAMVIFVLRREACKWFKEKQNG